MITAQKKKKRDDITMLETQITTMARLDLSTTGNCNEEERRSDHLRAMLHQESLSCYNMGPDYLQSFHHPSTGATKDKAQDWRRRISVWIYDVVDTFGFDREVVSFSMNYFDRYLSFKHESTGKSSSMKEFYLVAMTSLYVAIKLHGRQCIDGKYSLSLGFPIQDYVSMSKGMFDASTIEKMEMDLLRTLEWRLNPPTVTVFLKCLFQPLLEQADHPFQKASDTVFQAARFLTELAIFSPDLMFHTKPSVIAYVSILYSIEITPIPSSLRREIFDLLITTPLSPGMEQIQQASTVLQRIWPEDKLGAFPKDMDVSEHLDQEFPEEFAGSSPVCVRDERLQQPFESVQRKRTYSKVC